MIWRVKLLVYSQAKSRYDHARLEFLGRHGVTVPEWDELDPERRANWVRDTEERVGR